MPGQAGRPLPRPGEPAVPGGGPRGRRGQGRHLQVVPRERLGGLPGRRTRRHLGAVGVPRPATTSWTWTSATASSSPTPRTPPDSSPCRCCGSRNWTCRAAAYACPPSRSRASDGWPHLHPFLRRWDHHEGPKRKGRTTPPAGRGRSRRRRGSGCPWRTASRSTSPRAARYRTGDHWIVPARTATGSVEWPVDAARRPAAPGPGRHRPPLRAAGPGEGRVPGPWTCASPSVPLASSIPAADEATLAAEARAREEEAAAESSDSRSQTTAEAEDAVEGDN